MTEERKKKIKSEVIIWVLSIISIALLAFVISMRRAYINPVLAYHEDANTGNLVSDNLIDCENNAEATNDWQAKLLCYASIDNNTTYYYNAVYNKSGGNGNGGMAIYLTQDIPPTTLDNWFPNTPSNATRITINEDANANIHLNVNSGNYNYIAFYIGRTNDTSRKNFTNIQISLYNYNNTEYQPYGKIYYYSPRSYENKDNVYQETISNIYYEKYSGTNNNVTNKEDYNTINGYLHFNQTINGQDNLSNMKNIYINTEGYYTQNNDLRVVFTNTYSENIQKLSHVEIILECINEEDKNNYTNPRRCAMYDRGDGQQTIAVYINLKELYDLNQNGNIQNYIAYNDFTQMNEEGYIYNRITIAFDDQINSNEIIDILFYGLEVQKGSNTGTYEVGYNNGYNAAKQRYATSSYTSGYNTGKADGYAEGYDDGISENRGNTLVGLADTVLTAPFNMFNTMFDFNFLGVNLRYFILSIITLLIVIWVIKRFW